MPVINDLILSERFEVLGKKICEGDEMLFLFFKLAPRKDRMYKILRYKFDEFPYEIAHTHAHPSF